MVKDRDQSEGGYDPELGRRLRDELAGRRYRPSAWRAFFSQALSHGLSRSRESPGRRRSFFLWCLGGACLGGAVVASATVLGEEPSPCLWLGSGAWYLLACTIVYLHLGLVRDYKGQNHDRFLVPNGLSLLRVSLAPLLLQPLLSPAAPSPAGPLWIGFGVFIAVSDLLDGNISRLLHQTTPLGRMMDPMGDLVVMTVLGVGLYSQGVISLALLVILIVRYPGFLLGVILFSLFRGPAALAPSVIGKATTLITYTGLLLAALGVLTHPPWLTREWLRGVNLLLYPLAVNVAYLLIRGLRWGIRGAP